MCSFCWAKSRRAISSHTSQMVGVVVVAVLFFYFWFFFFFSSVECFKQKQNKSDLLSQPARIGLCTAKLWKCGFLLVYIAICGLCHLIRFNWPFIYVWCSWWESTTKTILITLIFVACFGISILNSLLSLLLAGSFFLSLIFLLSFLLFFSFLWFYQRDSFLLSAE